MAHLGTFNIAQTSEEAFYSHVVRVLKRSGLTKKYHGKYAFFDTVAEKEAPQFGYKWKDGKLSLVK